MDKNKDDIIDEVYHEPDGYGSIKATFEKARKKDRTITLSDVRKWFSEHVPRTTQIKGMNSFVANEPFQEYQADLFFFTKPENLEYKIGLIVIDIFTKFSSVILLKNKTPDVFEPALTRAFRNLGGKPKVLFTDDEGSFNSKQLKEYFQKEDIKHVVTRGHAAVAERAIRTIKSMINKRLKNTDKTWYEIIHEVLVVLNYMRKSSVTKMTPSEAREPKNLIKVKVNLERARKSSRKYPEVDIGDKVRIFRKRKNFEKEGVGIWSENRYEVKAIENVEHVGKLYHLVGIPRPLLRSEILL